MYVYFDGFILLNYIVDFCSKKLLFFKLCSLQVAVIRPVLLFIAAVLWTDGRYKRGLVSMTSAHLIEAVVFI